jgi:serine/threonine protein kinase
LDSATTPRLSIPYRADAARNGLLIMAALSPIWLFWVPYIAFIAIQAVFRAGIVGYTDLLELFEFLAGLFALCLLNVWLCLDNKLVLEAGRIRFPARFLLSFLREARFIGWTRFSTRLRWSELASLEFERWGQPSDDPEYLLFKFGLGGLRLRVDGFSKEDLRKLLLSLQAYCPELPIYPPINQVDLKLPGGRGSAVSKSFTTLWEEDLISSFGSTAYVPLESGQTLQNGRISVVGQVAFGGLSAIYLATVDKATTVMVKEAVVPANANHALKAKALEMFNREAAILYSLDHPRIARVLDHFIEQGRNYMVLQHIKGKDLRRVVKEDGVQPEAGVVRWALEAARLLEYLHGLEPPVVHRDLTPDNLLLENDGSITLIDFGAANSLLGTATGTLVGKQSYIPPEQLRGKAVPQSDLYALGCTIYFLLTGTDPEPLSCSSPRAINEDVSRELDEIVTRLTALELPDRIGSAPELIEKLARLRGEGALSLSTETT